MYLFSFQELISVTSGFVTYTALVGVGIVNTSLIILFGLNETGTVRRMISMLMFAVLPLLRVYKSQEIRNSIRNSLKKLIVQFLNCNYGWVG